MVQDNSADNHQIVLNTCPDMEMAQALARKLVQEHLAACINIVPGITSVYEWKGKPESGTECLLIIKTLKSCYPALERLIKDTHPYELPEILTVPVTGGLPDYLAWVSQHCLEKDT